MYIRIDVAALSLHNFGSIIPTKPNDELMGSHTPDAKATSSVGLTMNESINPTLNQHIWPTSSASVVSFPGVQTTAISEAIALSQTHSAEFPNGTDGDMGGNTDPTGRLSKNTSDACSPNYVKPSMKLRTKPPAISSSQDQISKYVSGVDLVQTPHSRPERQQSTYKSSRRTTSLLNLFLSNTQGTKRLYLCVREKKTTFDPFSNCSTAYNILFIESLYNFYEFSIRIQIELYVVSVKFMFTNDIHQTIIIALKSILASNHNRYFI